MDQVLMMSASYPFTTSSPVSSNESFLLAQNKLLKDVFFEY